MAAEVGKWLSRAAEADAAEDSEHGADRRGDEMPDWMADKLIPARAGHNNLDLQNNDCDARQLTWREWRGDEASAARRRYRRR